MRLLQIAGVAALVAVAAGCSPAAGPAAVGQVTRMQGAGTLKSGENATPLKTKMDVHRDDTVSTAVDARAELTFVDGTKLTVGENSEVKIDQFVFDETGSANRLHLSITGPFRFISGKLNKTVGSEAVVQTAAATLGLRGTDVWGGPIDQKYGVFLVEGQVTITTAAGSVTLTAPGTGVDILGADQPPGPIKIWPPDKTARALATVTFQ